MTITITKSFSLGLLLLLLAGCAAPLPVEGDGNTSLAQHDAQTLERILVRGQTSRFDVQRHFGQPSSLAQSGRNTYWNYTYRYQDPNRSVSGMKSLTIVVDPQGVVTDYDFQHNSFAID